MDAIKRTARRIAKRAIGSALDCLPEGRRRRVKERFELDFWNKLSLDADLIHERSHYEFFYTAYFGFTAADYAGKNVLDIGCGPLGSLEWAKGARICVGLDPLSHKYRELPLRSDADRMIYVAALSEAIPFRERSFDFVTSFNSLDHVGDVPATIREMKRVVAPGGHILLIVEIAHLPTFTEPHRLDRDLVKSFAPEFEIEKCEVFGVPPDHNLWVGIMQKLPWLPDRPGLLCARFRKCAPA
jgi:2-polyprenyl-3-methyl-5-hydroxy-6-metoxy-1,4-benzoquinol methylase